MGGSRPRRNQRARGGPLDRHVGLGDAGGEEGWGRWVGRTPRPRGER